MSMNKNAIHFLLLLVALLGVGTSHVVYADVTDAVKNNSNSNNVNKHKSPNSHRAPVVQNTPTDRKEILVNDSRSLSAFFILGIIINIVMILTFGWWFSKEWRRQK